MFQGFGTSLLLKRKASISPQRSLSTWTKGQSFWNVKSINFVAPESPLPWLWNWEVLDRAENLSFDKTKTLYFSVLDLLLTFQHPSRIDHIANLILLLIFHHYLRTVAAECSQASDLDGQRPNYLIGSASTGCWRWCENCENCKNYLVWSMTNVHNTHAVVEVQTMLKLILIAKRTTILWSWIYFEPTRSLTTCVKLMQV